VPTKKPRARIGHNEELQICGYALEFRSMQRTKLAEKIQSEVHWAGKTPEIEVLERKISHYRKESIDDPEDKAWHMATIDKYPVPPQAIPAILVCQKLCLKDKVVLSIREAKWISRLYALMAEEVRQDFVWRHGVKWLDWKSLRNEARSEADLDQSYQCDRKTESILPLRIEDGDHGAIECPKCQAAIGIGPTSQKAICAVCQGQFDIVRIPAGSEQSDVMRKETSITRNAPPIIKDVGGLYRSAKDYAHLEIIYQLIGQPFDSAVMDKLLVRMSFQTPNLDEMHSWLPYLAMGVKDTRELKEKIRRAIDEGAHNQEG
jgi:hypothetical protein